MAFAAQSKDLNQQQEVKFLSLSLDRTDTAVHRGTGREGGQLPSCEDPVCTCASLRLLQLQARVTAIRGGAQGTQGTQATQASALRLRPIAPVSEWKGGEAGCLGGRGEHCQVGEERGGRRAGQPHSLSRKEAPSPPRPRPRLALLHPELVSARPGCRPPEPPSGTRRLPRV